MLCNKYPVTVDGQTLRQLSPEVANLVNLYIRNRRKRECEFFTKVLDYIDDEKAVTIEANDILDNLKTEIWTAIGVAGKKVEDRVIETMKKEIKK